MSLDGASCFHEPWWLDIVAPGEWAVAEIERGGAIAAYWPYWKRHDRWVRRITSLPLTPPVGPWFKPAAGKLPARLAREHELIEALFESLRGFDVVEMSLRPGFVNWLGGLWAGARASPNLTLRVPDLAVRPAEADRARSDFVFVADPPLAGPVCALLVSALSELPLAAKPPVLLERLEAALGPRGIRHVYSLQDGHGTVRAASYVVVDPSDRMAHCLVAGWASAADRSAFAASFLDAMLGEAKSYARAFDAGAAFTANPAGLEICPNLTSGFHLVVRALSPRAVVMEGVSIIVRATLRRHVQS
ncbi:MAG: hypothetical protein JSS04_00430 [Proteobacteria bacterium]|nr:hypothetical protein [Pseudomonadota bacterium]